MKASQWFHLIVALLIAVAMLLGISPRDARALDNYCGGELQGGGLWGPYMDEWCKAVYGVSASAAIMRPDAYGWVCKVQGRPDAPLNVQSACQRKYPGATIATLRGIGVNDWWCLRAFDYGGHVVPVLLYPAEKVKASEAAWVASVLARVEWLMGGVRRFYRERTSAAVRGSHAFVLPTQTSARDWQNLAIATDHPSGGFPLDRLGFHNRVKQELANSGWSLLVQKSTVKVAGFVTLGAGYPEPPTSYGAAADTGGSYFSIPPSASYTTCSPSAANLPEYENAFFAVGNTFGAALGLPRTDHYPFNDLLLQPPNMQQSIMYLGNGTQSVLFPFEVAKLLPFLINWR